jgi:hypothetical protein
MEDEVHLLLVDALEHTPPETCRMGDILLSVIDFEMKVDITPAHVIPEATSEQAQYRARSEYLDRRRLDGVDVALLQPH